MRMQRIHSESGVALVLVLWMLLILSMLGGLAASTSVTELGIVANYRTSEIAFNTADAAVEYATTDPAIYTGIGAGTWGPNNVAVGGNVAQNVTVTFLATGNPPTGSKIGTKSLQANYFAISATGTGPNTSEATVEGQIAKMVPKP